MSGSASLAAIMTLPRSAPSVKHVVVAAAVFALLGGVVSACSSSSGGKHEPSSSTPPPSTTNSSVSTPPPSTTSSTPPLSRFENDPAVKALRRWAAQVGRTINAGHEDDAALDALMTPTMKRGIKPVTGGEVGRHYPGPVPFTPISVTLQSSVERELKVCVVAGGFSIDKNGGRTKHKVIPIRADLTRVGGRWLLNHFYTASFSCTGVHVAEVAW